MYDEYRARVAGTTIDDGTLLSTDYFNSFNEVIMLLGMLPDMPDMLDEILIWKFRTYEEHFRESGLPFAGLAIEAYAHVPPQTRSRFEQTVTEMREVVQEACRTLQAASNAGALEQLKVKAVEYSMRLQGLVDLGSAIVHGDGLTLDQGNIDDLFLEPIPDP